MSSEVGPSFTSALAEQLNQMYERDLRNTWQLTRPVPMGPTSSVRQSHWRQVVSRRALFDPLLAIREFFQGVNACSAHIGRRPERASVGGRLAYILYEGAQRQGISDLRPSDVSVDRMMLAGIEVRVDPTLQEDVMIMSGREPVAPWPVGFQAASASNPFEPRSPAAFTEHLRAYEAHRQANPPARDPLKDPAFLAECHRIENMPRPGGAGAVRGEYQGSGDVDSAPDHSADAHRYVVSGVDRDTATITFSRAQQAALGVAQVRFSADASAPELVHMSLDGCGDWSAWDELDDDDVED